MNKKAKYVVIEGVEGVGKTTQTRLLVDTLRARGFTVLETKEPGSSHSPLTMTLRGIMLDNQYDSQMTRPAREFISQAIRSIHLEQVIVPNIYKYDFIIQDRGILSGYAYGEACGNAFENLQNMANQNVASADKEHIVFPKRAESIYDCVIYLRGDLIEGLAKAKASKKEFETGDAMESRGVNFMNNVSKNMDNMSNRFRTIKIDVDGLSISNVHSLILSNIGMGK